jgi:hypothetical protein
MREWREATEGRRKIGDGEIRDFWSSARITETNQTKDNEAGAACDARGGEVKWIQNAIWKPEWK